MSQKIVCEVKLLEIYVFYKLSTAVQVASVALIKGNICDKVKNRLLWFYLAGFMPFSNCGCHNISKMDKGGHCCGIKGGISKDMFSIPTIERWQFFHNEKLTSFLQLRF